MFLHVSAFSAIFREVFNKEKYGNGCLCHRCEMVELKYHYYQTQFNLLKCIGQITFGARGGVMVKALRYKPAGRGFDYQLFRWNFSVT